MITAATWKNQVNKLLKSKDKNLDEMYSTFTLTPHSIDSGLIALYGAILHYNINWSDKIVNKYFTELRSFE